MCRIFIKISYAAKFRLRSAGMPNAVFWAKFANFGAPWNRFTNAKTPQKERRKCTLNMKMSPAARGRLRLPDLGLWSWTPLGAPPKAARNSHIVPFKLNCSLCSTIFYLNMSCLTPPSGAIPHTHVMYSRLSARHVCFDSPVLYTCGVYLILTTLS